MCRSKSQKPILAHPYPICLCKNKYKLNFGTRSQHHKLITESSLLISRTAGQEVLQQIRNSVIIKSSLSPRCNTQASFTPFGGASLSEGRPIRRWMRSHVVIKDVPSLSDLVVVLRCQILAVMPPSATASSPRSLVVAYVLWATFGVFGAHRYDIVYLQFSFEYVPFTRHAHRL